jgi:hypothetical protein
MTFDFDSFSAKLDAENAFWAAANRPDTYDIEFAGYAYSDYREMVKQKNEPYYHGDWVKADDYRRDIERLEKLLKDIELNMNKNLLDAIRTTGQLLLHHPTTDVQARDPQGNAVGTDDKDACCFCYTGATSVVATTLKVNWCSLDSHCDFILRGRGKKLMPSDWDSATPKQPKTWAQKLANYTGK